MVILQNPRVCFFAKVFFALVFTGLAVSTGRNLYTSFEPGHIYRKDFLQEYLLAVSAAKGVEPYSSLEVLKKSLLGEQETTVFRHPTPHPPSLIPLIFPLSYFSYETSAKLWSGFSLLALLSVIYMIFFRVFPEGRLSVFGLVLLALLGSQPVYYDLMTGQLGLVLSFAVTAAFLAIKQNRAIVGGAFLGLSLSIKLFGVPILLYLLAKKKWRPALVAGGVFVTLSLVAVSIIGLDQFIYYYTDVAPIMSTLYRADDLNQSLWTLGQRLFVGMSPGPQASIATAPLVFLPLVAKLFNLLIVFSAVIFGVYFALRMKEFRDSYSFLLGVSFLISPVAWVHGVCVFLLLIAVVTSHILERLQSRVGVYIWFFASFALYTGRFIRNYVVGLREAVGFYEGLATMSTMIATLVVLGLAYAYADKTQKRGDLIEGDG